MTSTRTMLRHQTLRWITVIIIGAKLAMAMGPSEEMQRMMQQIVHGHGFIAALDQSGGSTPKALEIYGYPEDKFQVGEDSMFDAMHSMRTRIMTSPAFTGDRVLGAILFEDTMKRQVNSRLVPEYLWHEKGIVPFLKVDKGLEDEENGVQLMKPMPHLDEILHECQNYGIFGTKMRSVIKTANPNGIKAIVKQQFEIGKQILAAGLVPIIEPEVDIHSPSKQESEDLLKIELLKHLDSLQDDQNVILKLSIPSLPDFYKECMEHPRCLRVVALSGGYTRDDAIRLLALQPRMIASFSRALTESLYYNLSDEEFDQVLDATIERIYQASKQNDVSGDDVSEL